MVPQACDNILSLSKITDCGYTFSGDREHTEFSHPRTGTCLVGYRSAKNFNVVDLQQEPPLPCYLLASFSSPFTREQVRRAHGVRELHVGLGHPSDDIFCIMLDSNCLVNCHFFAQDVRNAYAIFGECMCCIAGEIVSASALPSLAPSATLIGEKKLHIDILPYKITTIEGNTCGSIGDDAVSRFLFLVPMPNKGKRTLVYAILKIISLFNRFGYRVQTIVCEAERCLLATADLIGEYNVDVPTIPGEHNKRIERHVRSVKYVSRTIISGLSYVLEDKLLGELYQHAITVIKMRPQYDTRKPALECVLNSRLDITAVALYPVTSHKSKRSLKLIPVFNLARILVPPSVLRLKLLTLSSPLSSALVQWSFVNARTFIFCMIMFPLQSGTGKQTFRPRSFPSKRWHLKTPHV